MSSKTFFLLFGLVSLAIGLLEAGSYYLENKPGDNSVLISSTLHSARGDDFRSSMTWATKGFLSLYGPITGSPNERHDFLGQDPEESLTPTPPEEAPPENRRESRENQTIGLNLLQETYPWTTPAPLIQWTPDPRADFYGMQIDDSEECSSPLTEATIAPFKSGDPPPTRYKHEGYLPNGFYWVCLQSLGVDGKILGSTVNPLEIRAAGYGDPLVFNGHTVQRHGSPFVSGFSPDVTYLFASSALDLKAPKRDQLGFGKNFSVWSDPHDDYVLKLFVVDSKWNRILVYNKLPETNNALPDLVIGQEDFESLKDSNKVSPFALDAPAHVSVCQDGRLLVTDQGHNRILIWQTIPQDFNVPPDFVLGQEDLWSDQAGLSPSGLKQPSAAFCTPQGILVADAGNNRILVFESEKNPQAKLVIGQKNLTSRKSGCHQSSIGRVEDLLIYGDKLLVADSQNNRILVFDEFPHLSGEGASAVIGQRNFESCLPNRGTEGEQISSDTLSDPSALYFFNDSLLVSDRGNMRILVFPWSDDHVPSEASDVIGAQNFGPTQGQFYTLAPSSPGGSGLEVRGPREPFHGIFISDQGLWTITQKTQQMVRLALPTDW